VVSALLHDAFEERDRASRRQIPAPEVTGNSLTEKNAAGSREIVIKLTLPNNMGNIIAFLLSLCAMHYSNSIRDTALHIMKPPLTISDVAGDAVDIHFCNAFRVITAIGWVLISGMMCMLPPELSFPGIEHTVIMIDALGYQIRLPLERCRTYEVRIKLHVK
jgi:hypothetical protein